MILYLIKYAKLKYIKRIKYIIYDKFINIKLFLNFIISRK